MALGPHALSLVNSALLDAVWYQSAVHILECAVGLMIGTELVWKRIKKSGRSIIITTLTQSLGTFLLVSLVFGIVFYFTNIPLYLACLLYTSHDHIGESESAPSADRSGFYNR